MHGVICRLTLCLLLVTVWAGVLTASAVRPAAAGNDWAQQRDEERRERERDRAEREEERRQRQAEREAERAARDQEREERRQRQAEREAERATRDAEREREREERNSEHQAREQAREQEREEKTYARSQEREQRNEPRDDRDGGRDTHAPAPFASPAAAYQPAQQPRASEPPPSQTWNSDRDEDEDRGRDGRRTRQGEDSGRESPKSNRNDDKRETADKSNGRKDARSKDEDKRADDDEREDEDAERAEIAVPEPEEPPRTVAEWLNRISMPAAAVITPAPARVEPKAEPAPVKTSSIIRDNAATTAKRAQDKADGKKAATANTANTEETTVSADAPRRSGFDEELLRNGLVRKRQVLASGLDPAGLAKVRAMGFKTIATANSPGSTTPVMTLTVPGHLSEAKAQDWLQQAFPNARFGPNHVYHIHPASELAREPVAVPGKQSCRGADCFAKQLLNWKPALSECASGVVIGVIDTSFDMSHPALKGRSHELKDFRSSPIEAKSDWHGTAVLSVLAGDNSSTTPGLVPQARFLLAATFGAGQDGQASADALSVLAALKWLDGKAQIVNMSFSGPRNDEIELAIRAMAAKGVVFVAAAGNRGPNGPASYPAAYSDVIAVTAVSYDERGYRHATQGDYIDVAAPGVDVSTALPSGKTGLRTGTSFAAPFVTAFLAAMPAARQGVMGKGDVMARISTKDLGSPGRDRVFGEGLPQAPERCGEIGGVASLPWSPEAQRMSLGVSRGMAPQSASGARDIASESAMGWAMGFAP